MELRKYRIWCNTENIWVETGYIEETKSIPSVCPNNNTHTIDSSKTTIISKQVMQPSIDENGRMKVQASSRKNGLITHFCGITDDEDDANDIGGGSTNPFMYYHNVGDSQTEFKYIDFNSINNETCIKEGYILWKDCNFDTVSFDVVSRYATFELSTGQNFQLYPISYGDTIIVPAAGNGNCHITSDLSDPNKGGLVYMPLNENGVRDMAFWNATYNKNTGKYENITPAPYGNGEFNIFGNESVLYRFVNNLPLLGNSGTYVKLSSDDISKIGQGMRFKLTYKTYGDHNWSFCFFLTMNRKILR